MRCTDSAYGWIDVLLLRETSENANSQRAVLEKHTGYSISSKMSALVLHKFSQIKFFHQITPKISTTREKVFMLNQSVSHLSATCDPSTLPSRDRNKFTTQVCFNVSLSKAFLILSFPLLSWQDFYICN